MRRRNFLLGALGALGLGTAGGFALRPTDDGAPYDEYFRALNEELKKNGPMRSCMVIDLDRMDRNLDRVTQTLRRGGKHYRIVEKSLRHAR
jgi:hypothetical protein